MISKVFQFIRSWIERYRNRRYYRKYATPHEEAMGANLRFLEEHLRKKRSLRSD